MSHKAQYVFIDVETTGLDPENDKIVEIAAVHYSGRERLQDFKTLVNPGIPIPPTASAIHHLTDRDVADAPNVEEIWPALTAFTSGAICVAHNAPFDRSFLKALAEHRWLCTYRFARHLWPGLPSYTNQHLRYWLGLQIPFVGEHRALADIEVTAEVFFRELDGYRQLGLDWNIASVAAFIEKPVPCTHMPFGKYRGTILSDVPSDYLGWVVRSDAARDPDVRHAIMRELESRRLCGGSQAA